MNERIHIGTSGWSYKHWRSTFYPSELKIKDEFDYYMHHFDTVEINNTFYRLPAKEVFTSWKNKTPKDFLFVVKASRYITHMKKLHDPKESTAKFIEHASVLGEKLGAILFQLPPFMKANLVLLEAFLESLPQGLRCIIEFRNATWYHKAIYRLLEKFNCAFCIYELDGHISPIISTADFVYIRLHGPGNKYQGSYSDETLRQWADRCKQWARSKEVFVYFDNDEQGYAAFNAARLKVLLTGDNNDLNK
jgi:uncharacterized protein YecE (DUF72 family)